MLTGEPGRGGVIFYRCYSKCICKILATATLRSCPAIHPLLLSSSCHRHWTASCTDAFTPAIAPSALGADRYGRGSLLDFYKRKTNIQTRHISHPTHKIRKMRHESETSPLPPKSCSFSRSPCGDRRALLRKLTVASAVMCFFIALVRTSYMQSYPVPLLLQLQIHMYTCSLNPPLCCLFRFESRSTCWI